LLSDGNVYVFRTGQPHAVLVLAGHGRDVNKIQWDPSRKMLASCSDDATVRVWRPFERAAAVVLQGHTKEVYTIRWAPEQQRVLVSAAFDQTARIWDVQARTCLHVVTKHQGPIYSVAFSPRGIFFVTAGADCEVYVWRLADGELVATYQTTGGVFEAVWDVSGRSIALCLTDATVVVIPAAAMSLPER
jgi:transducin (beta)-like 1